MKLLNYITGDNRKANMETHDFECKQGNFNKQGLRASE